MEPLPRRGELVTLLLRSEHMMKLAHGFDEEAFLPWTGRSRSDPPRTAGHHLAGMLDVGTAQAIRHQLLFQGRSIRAVAEETGHARNTVRRLARSEGDGPRHMARAAPKRESVVGALDALLVELTPRTRGKQRLTTKRLHELLRERGVDVGYTLVKQLMRERRRRSAEVFRAAALRAGRCRRGRLLRGRRRR